MHRMTLCSGPNVCMIFPQHEESWINIREQSKQTRQNEYNLHFTYDKNEVNAKKQC